MTSDHWDGVWRDRDPEAVTWYQADPARSLRLVRSHSTPADGVIDVGGGASRLVDGLLDAGYRDVTVLDVSPTALAAARDRLGERAGQVTWVVADITSTTFQRTYAIWHDRAVFHFLVDDGQRQRYLAALRDALAPGGHLVLATFGPGGPERCSGLPVQRYDAATAQRVLGDDFALVDDEDETHVAPSGVQQQFCYAVFRRVR